MLVYIVNTIRKKYYSATIHTSIINEEIEDGSE